MSSHDLGSETRPLPGEPAEVVVGSDEGWIRFADRREMIHPHDGRVFFSVEVTAPTLSARLERVTNFADGHGLVDFLAAQLSTATPGNAKPGNPTHDNPAPGNAKPGNASEWTSADRDLTVTLKNTHLNWRIQATNWSAEVTTPFTPKIVDDLRDFLRIPEPVNTAVIQEATRWGRNAAERAAHGAGMSLPAWKKAVEHTAIGPGTRVLDLACGSGEFCRLATDVGAKAVGIDASVQMVEVAKRQAPGAEFLVWPLGRLPWEDNSFDVVTAFNALFFADDQAHAFEEMVRTSKDYVVVCGWHPQKVSDLLVVGREVRGARTRRNAELPRAQEELTIHIPVEHPNENAMMRSMLSVGAYQRVIESEGEERVAEKIRKAAERFRTADGGYRFDNYYLMQIFRKNRSGGAQDGVAG